VSDLNEQISAALENGAKYLAMGEIAANTGLLVSQSPRDVLDYDIIVNNIDQSKGCMVDVVHSRDKFEAETKGFDFDFLLFVYAPSEIENGVVKPSIGKNVDETRGIYIFPRDIVRDTIDNQTATFDPKNIKTDGKKDSEKYKEYKDAYHLISELVPNSPPGFI
jgi:hypothetical protein